MSTSRQLFQEFMAEKKNLTEIIEGIDMFSVFARLMRTSGLNDIIAGSGPLTIFAPTNDAFRMIPDRVMNGWLSENSQTMLRTVLSYHIVTGRLMAANLGLSSKSASSISGHRLEFSDNGGLKVNKSGVQARNIEAGDGIVHALDTVLTPPANGENVIAIWPGADSIVQGDIAPRKEPLAMPDETADPAAVPRQPIPIDSRRPAERDITPAPERKWKLS